MPEFQIEEISDRRHFLQQWQVAADASNTHIFASTQWLSGLFNVLPESEKLLAVYAQHSEASRIPVAFMSAPTGRSRMMRLSTISFMETGDQNLDRVYPEYIDLLDRDCDASDRKKALRVLFDSYKNNDQFIFRNVSGLLKNAVTITAADIGYECEVFRSQPTYQVDLSAFCTQGKVFLDGVSKSLRTKIKRSVREYEKRGKLELSVASSAPEREQAWDDLCRLHRTAWRARGEAGVFDNPSMRSFHETLFLQHPSVVDFLTLTCDGQVVGVLYNFLWKTTAYNYQSGFQFEESNKLVPGFVLHAMAADHYAAKGFGIYDMLAGEAEYKRRLAHQGETIYSLVVTRPGLRTTARAFLKKGFASIFPRKMVVSDGS